MFADLKMGARYPPSSAGDIEVWEDSVAGTLNDFLGTVTENDVRPEALKRFEAMVDEVSRLAADVSMNTTQSEQSARFASASAKAAAASVHRDRWVQPVQKETKVQREQQVRRGQRERQREL